MTWFVYFENNVIVFFYELNFLMIFPFKNCAFLPFVIPHIFHISPILLNLKVSLPVYSTLKRRGGVGVWKHKTMKLWENS